MKFVNGKVSLLFRLGATVAALLLGQQAMAVGTLAGTDVVNTASVDYFVGGVDQTDIPSNTVTFKVDRRVDFTLVPVSTPDLEPVAPGEDDAWVDFLLTNTSNSDLDFLLDVLNTTSGDPVDGSGTDDADMSNIRWAVSAATVSGGDPDPVLVPIGPQIVDELPPDEAIRIRIWGDAAATMTNGQIAGADLTATAREAGAAGLGGVLAYGVADDPLTVQNVDPNGADGVRISVDGYIVETATLAVTKANTIVGGGPAIPGATVEYTITIVNTGTAAATAVTITDTLMAELTLVLGAFAGPPAASDFQIDNDGVLSGCTAAVDGDDCELVGAALTFDNITLAAPVAPAVSTTLVVTFRATIRGTGAT